MLYMCAFVSLSFFLHEAQFSMLYLLVHHPHLSILGYSLHRMYSRSAIIFDRAHIKSHIKQCPLLFYHHVDVHAWCLVFFILLMWYQSYFWWHFRWATSLCMRVVPCCLQAAYPTTAFVCVIDSPTSCMIFNGYSFQQQWHWFIITNLISTCSLQMGVNEGINAVVVRIMHDLSAGSPISFVVRCQHPLPSWHSFHHLVSRWMEADNTNTSSDAQAIDSSSAIHSPNGTETTKANSNATTKPTQPTTTTLNVPAGKPSASTATTASSGRLKRGVYTYYYEKLTRVFVKWQPMQQQQQQPYPQPIFVQHLFRMHLTRYRRNQVWPLRKQLFKSKSWSRNSSIFWKRVKVYLVV